MSFLRRLFSGRRTDPASVRPPPQMPDDADWFQYERYTAACHEGDYVGRSAGVFLSGNGYPHIAVMLPAGRDTDESVQRTIVHELTHFALAGLDLPRATTPVMRLRGNTLGFRSVRSPPGCSVAATGAPGRFPGIPPARRGFPVRLPAITLYPPFITGNRDSSQMRC